VELVDALDSGEFVDSVSESFVQLVVELETVPVLLMLVVDNKHDYELKYEHSDFDKWAISKMDRGTGVPAGID
jgi:hypothetical protein